MNSHRDTSDARQTRDRLVWAVRIVAGAALVAAFLGWLVVRHHDALRPLLGMDSVLGWVGHGVAVLVLVGGLALLARGTLRRGTAADAGHTRDTGETPS